MQNKTTHQKCDRFTHEIHETYYTYNTLEAYCIAVLGDQEFPAFAVLATSKDTHQNLVYVCLMDRTYNEYPYTPEGFQQMLGDLEQLYTETM